jgi:hypothetical protein
MNKHIELPIAGNTFGTFTATFTGATLPVAQEINSAYTVAAVFCASETDTITHIGLPFAAATGAAAKTFRMELRNVNSNGFPGSTVYANSATLAHTVIGTTYTTATTTNPVVAQIPLITPYQITRGSLYAVCAVPIGGTWSGVSYMNVVQSYGALPASMNQTNLPYLFINYNNIPTRVSSPIFLLVSSTKFYGAVGPYLQLVSIANTSTAYGNFFTLPASFGTSVRLSGLKFPINTFTKAGVDTYNIKVYSGTGTTLYVNDTFDMDVSQSVSPVSNMFVHQFDTTVTLYPGVKYFIGFATPSGDTISFNCQRLENYPEDFDKVRKMNTGGLIDFQAGLITSAGSVAVTDAYYFPFNPLIDLIDPAPSAGGASTTAVFNQGLFN